jgi:hypothetical protein
MKYLHSDFQAGPDDLVEVTLDGQANVLLMDSYNFEKYKKSESYRYHGGLAKVSPIRLRPPHQGNWHLVVDLGGYTGTVRAEIRVLQGANA